VIHATTLKAVNPANTQNAVESPAIQNTRVIAKEYIAPVKSRIVNDGSRYETLSQPGILMVSPDIDLENECSP
jgi:hypothetical protein